jgi:hypothetical protein
VQGTEAGSNPDTNIPVTDPGLDTLEDDEETRNQPRPTSGTPRERTYLR